MKTLSCEKKEWLGINRPFFNWTIPNDMKLSIVGSEIISVICGYFFEKINIPCCVKLEITCRISKKYQFWKLGNWENFENNVEKVCYIPHTASDEPLKNWLISHRQCLFIRSFIGASLWVFCWTSFYTIFISL